MGRVLLHFADMQVPAEIDAPPELLQVLATFGVANLPGDPAQSPSLVVTSAEERFHLSGPAYRNPFSVLGLDAVAGSIMAGLAACKALSVAGDVLCVHGAAARLGDRTLLFIAPFGTGKSSLMAELALRGAEILTDDVVLVNVRERTATGLPMPMRLRRSFVKDASPELSCWIEDQRLLAGPRYTYLVQQASSCGPRQLTDIVLLNRARSAEAGAVFEEASPGQLIPRILWHNMARHHAPSAISQLASALAMGVRGRILHFADAASAAVHLLSGSQDQPASNRVPQLVSTRRDSLVVTRTDRGAIVSDDETGRIFEVNESAFVILTLFQQVSDDASLWQMLCTLYPEVSAPELGTHINTCLPQLVDSGLVDFARAETFSARVEAEGFLTTRQ